LGFGGRPSVCWVVPTPGDSSAEGFGPPFFYPSLKSPAVILLFVSLRG